MIKIGERLRKLRMQRLYTLQQVAELTNLTKGYISQLENNQTSPSLKTLEEVLITLGSTLEDFFAPQKDYVKIVKKEEQNTIEHNDLKYKVTKLMPNVSHKVDIEQVEIEPFGVSKFYDKIDGEYTIICIESQVILNCSDKRYTLKKGDVACFPGIDKFQLENKKNAKTKALVVITPPNIGGNNI